MFLTRSRTFRLRARGKVCLLLLATLCALAGGTLDTTQAVLGFTVDPLTRTVTLAR